VVFVLQNNKNRRPDNGCCVNQLFVRTIRYVILCEVLMTSFSSLN